MSEVMLNVIDSQQAVHSPVDLEFAIAAVAALSAEPETLAELNQALARFCCPDPERPFAWAPACGNWSEGMSQTKWDAGLLILDLPARLIVHQCRDWHPALRGEAPYRDEDGAYDLRLSYHLFEEWEIRPLSDVWQSRARQRRKRRLASPPSDARPILFGPPMTQFVASRCAALADENRVARRPLDAPIGRPIAEIHAQWLTTPREDLRGQTPREILLFKREFLADDMDDRCMQWTLLGHCPPALSRSSAAFRFGGFGTHEILLYYDLMRFLIEECWSRAQVNSRFDLAAETERLAGLIQWWMYEPDVEGLHGKTPREIIELERLRVPMTLSGDEAVIDDDCPLCQLMAEDDSPLFWRLDAPSGYPEVDPEFVFSFHRTREEWEQEQAEWEEMSRRWEKEQQQMPSDEARQHSIWTRSFSDSEMLDELEPGPAMEMALVGIGGHLAELGADLKQAGPRGVQRRTSLNRLFGNLTEAVRTRAEWLIAPAGQRLCDELELAADEWESLEAKCDDLSRRVSQLIRLFEEWDEDDEDDSNWHDESDDNCEDEGDIPF